MVWVLFLHIGSLLSWAAALCILLLLMSHTAPAGPQMATESESESESERESIERLWFTRLASPAGLLTIVSGTVIFAVSRNFDSWLLLKLTLVTGLVICHVTAGLLILYSNRPEASAVTTKCIGLLCVVLLLLLSIIVVVLLKPGLEALQWFA